VVLKWTILEGNTSGRAESFSKHVNGGDAWYYGPLAMRADSAAWEMLKVHLREEVAGPLGVAGVLLPLVGAAPRSARAGGPLMP